jgi:hypothetical protein
MPQDPHSADRDNAPQPPGEAKRAAGAERYPPVDRTDSIKGGEGRSFDPKDRHGAAPDDDDIEARDTHFTGPGGDPAEGKR